SCGSTRTTGRSQEQRPGLLRGSGLKNKGIVISLNFQAVAVNGNNLLNHLLILDGDDAEARPRGAKACGQRTGAHLHHRAASRLDRMGERVVDMAGEDDVDVCFFAEPKGLASAQRIDRDA